MQTTSPLTPASPIELPKIDTDEPVAVIPVASVAPPDGEPTGERINTFALAPVDDASTLRGSRIALRDRVLEKPLACLAAAFSLGFMLARVMR